MTSAILKLSASLALLAVGVSAVVVSEEVWQLGISIQKTEVVLCNTIAVVPSKIDTLTLEVNEANKILNITSAALIQNSTVLVGQTGEAQRSLSQTLAGVDNTTAQLKANLTLLSTMENSITKVVSDPNIPALVRDARTTVALTGSTMAHVRTTANVIAEQAPAMGESTVRIADNVAGVTADVHKITTDFSKPQPWWRKTLGYLGDGVKIGGAIF